MLHALRRRLSGPSADEQARAGDRRQPVVPVVVELGMSGWQVIEQHAGLKDTVIRDVVAALRRHLRALGIPGHPEVQLRPIPGATDALRLLVHGRRCGQPNERVAEVLGCLAGTERRSLSEVPVQDVGQSIAAVCTAAIHRRPSLLLGPEQLRRYQAALGQAHDAGLSLAWPPSEQRLRAVLEPVIGAGVSIGDVQAVTPILVDGELDAVPSVYIAERLIDRLRGMTVQILLNAETLRWLSMHESEPKGAFAALREELFAESGSLFPDFALVQANELPSRTVAFGMNSLPTAPTRLPDRNAFQAVAGNLESELRAHRGWFVSTSVVEERLQQLELVFPDLVGAIHDRYPTEWLAALGRVLFREEVSTRNLKEILERLLDLGDVGRGVDVIRLNESVAVVARPTITSLPDPRAVVSYLRQRSNEQLHETFSVPWEGSVAFLGTAIEGVASTSEERTRSRDQEQVEVLLEAVQRKIDHSSGPVSVAVPSVPVRSVVRELLEPEFPLVPVIATQELPIAFRSLRDPSETPT
jgi:hypothetical protein